MYWKDLHYWGIKISRDAVTHVVSVLLLTSVEVTQLNLGQNSEARFGQDFNFRFSQDPDVWLRFWSWCLIEILWYKLNPRVRCAFGNVLYHALQQNSRSKEVFSHRPLLIARFICKMVSAFITFTWHVNLFAIDVVNQTLHCQCTCVGAGSRELCLKTYTSTHIFDTLVTFQPPAIRRGLRREKSYKSNNPMLQDFEINSVNKCFIGTFKANIIQANKHNICKTRANGAFEFCLHRVHPRPEKALTLPK